VVIVEGNYILLEEGSWKDISDMFDEKWFIRLIKSVFSFSHSLVVFEFGFTN